MRVALLGGSFNPPHVGHQLAAQYVHATQEVDEVWLMASPAHRANILEPVYTRVGIGVQDAGLFGRMFTQEFAG